jgi:glycosyltransferase involved in cell wall biosynthesis
LSTNTLPIQRLKSLSVFFPAYNEVDNVEPLVTEAAAVLPRVAEHSEIIIVDDGSTDGTGPLADELASEYENVRVVHNRPNRGYGGAVKAGLDSAGCEWVFFTDGDRQFRLDELPLLVGLAGEADLVLGYRIKRSDPPHRLLNAWMYKTMIRALFGLKVRDIDCAYKLINRRVLDAIRLESEGALVSAELLIKARKLGFRFAEIGVRHYPRVAGTQTGAKLSVILRMFRELFRMRARLANYGEAAVAVEERPERERVA